MASNKNYMLNDKFPKHIKNATSTSDGLMSSTDKSKLDELFEFGLLAPVTREKDGVMTKEDKIKLDEIETGANRYIHPNNKDIRHVTDEQIKKWDTQTHYTNDTPTPISLGGIDKGETFDNVDYKEIITRLLYPYIYPQISNIRIIPSDTVIEKGNVINVDSIYFQIDTPSLSENDSVHYDFKLNNDTFHSIDTSDKTININAYCIIKDTATVSVTITDDINNKEKDYNLINYNFVYPFYYGVLSNDIVSDKLVTSKTKLLQLVGNKTLKFTTNNEKILFAYPKSYGKLKTIYDANNFNILNTFTCDEINITGLDSNSVEYYVYTNELSTVNDYNIKFNFS